MAKTQKTHKLAAPWYKSIKRQHLVILGVVAVLILLFFAVNGPNKAKRIYYSNQAHSAFSQELKTLGQPLNILGIQGAQPAKCTTQPFYLYDTPQLQCQTSAKAYIIIGTSAPRKTQFNSAAAQLDSELKTGGWTVTSNAAPTLTAWFQGITSGKDYYPDISGYKIWGSKHCNFDINVAYSSPKPPAFAIQMYCGSPLLQKLRDEGV